jgi:phosphatidylglycerol lysyltransferase
MNRSRLSGIIGATATIAIIVVALWFLHRELAGISFAAVMSNIGSIPTWTLFAAAGFTICSYTVLTGYDAAGLHYLGSTIPYRQTALTSFMAFAVGHNVGVASLSGGSIRYRMYTLAGLSAPDVARLIVFISSTFGIGASGLLGVALLFMPATQTAVLHVPPSVIQLAGYLLLSVPFIYVAFTAIRSKPVQLNSWMIAVPKPRIAVAQVCISAADIAFAAATLYVLLEPQLHIGFFSFLGVYMLALGAGVISSAPGGIGVFEAVLVAALPQVELTALLGIIIIYRLIYYVGPLALALLVLVGHESRQHGRKLKEPAEKAADWLSGIVPQAIGALVFLAGVVLLVSGASPAVDSRLTVISEAIPLPVLELSHLGGSVIGMGLLILARGLYRRLHGAYQFALVALALGVVLTLVKGLDYEEASILVATGAALWFSRDEFYRRESLLSQRFSAKWIAAIVLVFLIAVWIGLLSYRHVEYSDELWWQFAFDAEAPRMLRASLVAAVTAVSFALWKIFRAGPEATNLVSTPDEMDAVRSVLASARSSSANVALLGDKQFLWSADRQAFIMYQVSGNSWIAMGDPVGAAGHHEELTWAFRELVDRHDGRTVFYQVSDEFLSLYVDLGLTLSKIGEDATASLRDFSLQGSDHAELRQALNRARKNGAVFQVVPRADITAVVDDLRRISDSWLADKSSAEKGFSLGSFSESYIANFDCAVVKVNDVIVAFANLWPAPASGELSIDLMRYDQAAPKGIMDYLFVELMLWGSANGYQSFNLGMAPLSGLEQRSLAPLWHKIGHLIFTHGENFYNFEGLRNYKNKFDPKWQPRYLACPGGWWNLPRTLVDVSRLISGGIGKMVGMKT